MDLTHHISVPAPLDDTWAVFASPQRLAPCFPGATITSAEGDDFAGSIKVKLGPLALVYEGAGRYVKRDENLRRLEIEFHGEDRRGHGAAEGTIVAAFAAAGEATVIEVNTDLTITGKPEQFGSRVLADVNDRLLDQFASCMAGRFADGSIHDSDSDSDSDDDTSDPGASGGADNPAEPTVEIPEVPADVAGGPPLGPTEGSSGQSAPSARGSRPAATRAAVPTGPPVWVPANNYSEPDLAVIARVLPPLLKRYWPFLGGAGVAALVVSKIAGRKSKKKKRR